MERYTAQVYQRLQSQVFHLDDCLVTVVQCQVLLMGLTLALAKKESKRMCEKIIQHGSFHSGHTQQQTYLLTVGQIGFYLR